LKQFSNEAIILITKNKLKEILDRALFKNENLRHELRNIVIQNHNINHLIDRIVSEIK